MHVVDVLLNGGHGQGSGAMTVMRLDAGNTDSALNTMRAARCSSHKGFQIQLASQMGFAGMVGVMPSDLPTTPTCSSSTVTRTHGRGTDACFRRGEHGREVEHAMFTMSVSASASISAFKPRRVVQEPYITMPRRALSFAVVWEAGSASNIGHFDGRLPRITCVLVRHLQQALGAISVRSTFCSVSGLMISMRPLKGRDDSCGRRSCSSRLRSGRALPTP